MNPYQAPLAIDHRPRDATLRRVLAMFCFGWAFGTILRAQLDSFGCVGLCVFAFGVVLWQSAGRLNLRGS